MTVARATPMLLLISALLLNLGTGGLVRGQTPVPAPQGVQASAGDVKREGVSVEITWKPVEGATGYQVERSAVGKPPQYDWMLVGEVAGGETATYVDQIWAPRDRYCYQVRTISGPSRSEGSEEACVLFGIIDYPPYAPGTGTGLSPADSQDRILGAGLLLAALGSLAFLGVFLAARQSCRQL
ncbi:MAG: hypothetical protein KJ053_10830 [Dehalococcoidia bacterium]|nr:hypothetical protein [Dehalococcoidia bacterium]